KHEGQGDLREGMREPAEGQSGGPDRLESEEAADRVDLFPREAAMPADEKRRDRELAELAALADGSLPLERRKALEQRVAASPRLQALLREQREALEAVRALDQRAPRHLR